MVLVGCPLFAPLAFSLRHPEDIGGAELIGVQFNLIVSAFDSPFFLFFSFPFVSDTHMASETSAPAVVSFVCLFDRTPPYWDAALLSFASVSLLFTGSCSPVRNCAQCQWVRDRSYQICEKDVSLSVSAVVHSFQQRLFRSSRSGKGNGIWGLIFYWGSSFSLSRRNQQSLPCQGTQSSKNCFSENKVTVHCLISDGSHKCIASLSHQK